ncbi:MAG TPA: PPOX class F420-dependent oxidoreductase [Aggregatilineales bacterium]|nr:PPOX class F420-dependent oxidoreductase [Aggregatilineales bacterium]
MDKMTPEEYKKFLLDTPRTGKLAVVRVDGRPHVSPIWFAMDGDDIMFTSWHETVKVASIRRDPRVSLCVDYDQPPFHFVIVEGEAEILDPTPEEKIKWTTRIAGRYMGDELAESYGKRNGVEGELLLRLKPTKVIAIKNMSD